MMDLENVVVLLLQPVTPATLEDDAGQLLLEAFHRCFFKPAVGIFCGVFFPSPRSLVLIVEGEWPICLFV